MSDTRQGRFFTLPRGGGGGSHEQVHNHLHLHPKS